MLFEDILEEGKPTHFIASEWQFKSMFGPYFELWHKRRIEKRIKQKTIFPKKFKGKVPNWKFIEYNFNEIKKNKGTGGYFTASKPFLKNMWLSSFFLFVAV